MAAIKQAIYHLEPLSRSWRSEGVPLHQNFDYGGGKSMDPDLIFLLLSYQAGLELN